MQKTAKRITVGLPKILLGVEPGAVRAVDAKGQGVYTSGRRAILHSSRSFPLKSMIYFDYAATAPLRPAVSETVTTLCSEFLGNPSSPHRAGRKARHLLESAREECATLLGAEVEEMVFCSGATEADNLALFGVLEHPDTRCHRLLTSTIEHAAIFIPAQRLGHRGVPVDWLRVDQSGLVDLQALRFGLSENPSALVSIMAVNNEIGTRQPLLRIAEICREFGAVLHTDAVQDPNLARELIQEGAVDLVSLSGHKLGGLPGGLLYVRKGIPLAPRMLGGAQEDGRRAGTSEVLRASSLAIALRETFSEVADRLLLLRNRFEEVLKAGLPQATLLGPEDPASRAHQISSWLFGNLPAEALLVQWDLKGLCASSGSACASNAIEPSRVLAELGVERARRKSLVRFSFGWGTTEEDVELGAKMVLDTVESMAKRERVVQR